MDVIEQGGIYAFPSDDQIAEQGWKRTMELRWLQSPTPGEGPTLQQKWTRFIINMDCEEERWLDVETVSY